MENPQNKISNYDECVPVIARLDKEQIRTDKKWERGQNSKVLQIESPRLLFFCY